MAKKQSRSSATQSTAKKPLEVSSPEKKPLKEVASTSKKPVEDASTSRKKKNQPVINTPPKSLTDDEEMETEEEEEEDEADSSSEEEDEPKEPVKTSSAPAPVVTATVIQSSGSESGSETEIGETDSETEPPPPPPAPVATPRTLRKRTSEVTATTEVNANKRAKTETEETDNTAKKALFQRVWSEDDEVALLQGLVDYKDDTKKNPSDDLSGCYEIVKESINLEGKTSKQFSSKVGKLKKKYLGEKKKTYTNADDLKCLDLCKKIWGTDVVIVKSKEKVKVRVEDDDDAVRVGDDDGGSDWFERSFLVGAIKSMGLVEDEALKKKWSLVTVENKNILEEKLKLVQAGEFQCLNLKAELLREATSAIFNA